MTARTLFGFIDESSQPTPAASYDHARDGHRLECQRQRVFDLMSNGEWWSPEQLEAATGYRWASISARTRDFRKARYGGHIVNRRCIGGGCWEYQLVVKKEYP